MEYNKEVYNRVKKLMVSQPIIYVEGKGNKVFYQQLDELSNLYIENGDSCVAIKEKVALELNSYGIVDKDFNHTLPPKIFPINFYSIENISLMYISEFSDLQNQLIKYINITQLENARLQKQILKIHNHPHTKRTTGYSILSSGSHHNQFEPYILENIVCYNSFLQYQNLKNVVSTYIKYYKSAQQIKIKYLINLANYLPTKSLIHIFDEDTLKKFNKTFGI